MRTIAISVLIVAAVSLLLVWLGSKSDTIAWVVFFAGLATVVYALWQVRLAPEKPKALAVILVAVVLGLAVSLLISLAFRDGEGEPIAAAEPSPTPAQTPSPTPTAALTTEPTVTSTPTPAGTANPTAVVPGEATGVFVDEDGTIVVATDGGPPAGLWLFTLEAAGQPIRLVLDGSDYSAMTSLDTTVSAEISDGRVELNVRGVDGPWAVVTADGVRFPALGHEGGDARVDRSAEGPIAAELETSLAAVQAAVPGLDDEVGALVLSLVGRQVRDGAYLLERTVEGSVEPPQLIEVTGRWPLFSTRFADGSGVYVGVEEISACLIQAGALACESLPDASLALRGALAIVEETAALDLSAAPSVTFDGLEVPCVEIVATPTGGPSLGRTCWLADGTPVLIERPEQGDRQDLVETTVDIDEDALVAPG